MDFRLSDETQEWKDYCRKFAREVIRPAIERLPNSQAMTAQQREQAIARAAGIQ
jgi:hypothetical protein